MLATSEAHDTILDSSFLIGLLRGDKRVKMLLERSERVIGALMVQIAYAR